MKLIRRRSIGVFVLIAPLACSRDHEGISNIPADAIDDLLDATKFDLGPDPVAPRSTSPRVDAAAIPPDVPYADATDAGELLTPPRPIAPLSAMRVTTRRPTFRWELPSGVIGARIELCGDPDCHRPLLREDVNGANFRPASSLPPGVIFWHVAPRNDSGVGSRWSPIWEFGVRHRDTPVDSTVGMLKDYNGDGFDDLVVSINGPNNFNEVILGSTQGVDRTSGIRLESARASLPPGGDINRDGLADLLACSGLEGEGSAFIHFGRREGVAARSDIHLTIPIELSSYGIACTLNDVNGDGFGDVVVGASGLSRTYVYNGSEHGISLRASQEITLGEPGDRFGETIEAVGDVNGDGYGDIIVGSSHWNHRTGRIIVLHGSQGGLQMDAMEQIDSPNELFSDFGTWAAGVGDLNGDALSDFIIISQWSTSAFVYLGRRVGVHLLPDYVITPPVGDRVLGYNSFGGFPSCGGDVNADGYGDIVLGGACEVDPDGGLGGLDHCGPSRAYLFLGAEDLTGWQSRFSFREEALAPRSPSGFTIIGGTALPGDVNGDGFDDILLGAFNVSFKNRAHIGLLNGRTELSYGRYDQIIEFDHVYSIEMALLESARFQVSSLW